MTYIRYTPSVEQPQPDEQEAIDGIIRGMTQQSETAEAREHHAVRASHAKSTGLVVGTLTISGDLPAELAQGLFARGGTHPAAIRLRVAEQAGRSYEHFVGQWRMRPPRGRSARTLQTSRM